MRGDQEEAGGGQDETRRDKEKTKGDLDETKDESLVDSDTILSASDASYSQAVDADADLFLDVAYIKQYIFLDCLKHTENISITFN